MHPLPGTETASDLLFWSPDSRFLAFSAGGKLQKIDISGGPAETICVLSKAAVGGSWNKDGVIVFGQFLGPLMRVSAAGGVATPLTVLHPARGDSAHIVPYFLPDGRHFVYLHADSTSSGISVGSLDAKPEQQDYQVLIQASLGGVYVPSSDPGAGQMLFVRGLTLMAQPFDARHLKTSGAAFRIGKSRWQRIWPPATFSASDNGSLVYWSPGSVESQLTWFDSQGKVLSTVGQPGPYGERQTFSRRDTSHRVQDCTRPSTFRGCSIPRGAPVRRLELDQSADAFSAVWAADGRSIIFSYTQAGENIADIYETHLIGGTGLEPILKSDEWKTPFSWSPDGRFLLYATGGGATKDDLWVVPLQADRKPVPFLRTEFNESDGHFSPDGRRVAYVSDESGRAEVYVRSFSPGPPASPGEGKWLISNNGGHNPMWRQDGKQLYYIDLDGKLMAVSLAAGSEFEAGVPKTLFQALPRGDFAAWAPSPDGKRFLFLVPETQEAAPLTVVLNWQAGLKK